MSDGQLPALGTSAVMFEECIVFTRERSEEAVFSGKNYISVKAYSGKFLVTLRWRIFGIENNKFINRICKLE